MPVVCAGHSLVHPDQLARDDRVGTAACSQRRWTAVGWATKIHVIYMTKKVRAEVGWTATTTSSTWSGKQTSLKDEKVGYGPLIVGGIGNAF